MLIVANHVTSFDAPLVLYALPGGMRRRVAIAMSGEMLDDWRHARNQDAWWQNLLAPFAYWLVTALFNVFPLPRTAGFRRSFSHVGEALDHGYHVLVFPEGHRSDDGSLQRFRSGIGLLAKESGAAILPVALVGLGAAKQGIEPWFRSGGLAVHVGDTVTIDAAADPGADRRDTARADRGVDAAAVSRPCGKKDLRSTYNRRVNVSFLSRRFGGGGQNRTADLRVMSPSL